MNYLFAVAALACAVTVSAKDREPALKTESALRTEDEKTLYAVGMLLSRSIQSFDFSPAELKIVQQGFGDGALGHRPLLDAQSYAPKVQALQGIRFAASGAKAALAGAAYLDNAAKQNGTTKTASGIVMTTLTVGQGASPKPSDRVTVHYEGKLIDGTVFDSSIQRGAPAEFPLNGVIPCWTEAVQLMKVGGKAQIICPASLAYGDRGSAPLIRPGSTLVFEVQLIGILKDLAPSAPAQK